MTSSLTWSRPSTRRQQRGTPRRQGQRRQRQQTWRRCSAPDGQRDILGLHFFGGQGLECGEVGWEGSLASPRHSPTLHLRV